MRIVLLFFSKSVDMDYFSSLSSSIGSTIGSTIGQSRAFQWSINKVRGTVYPYYYRDNAWEANRIVDNSNIWLGGLASACDRSALRVRNITRIITAVYDISPVFPDDPELIYLNIPVLDTPTEEIAAHFEKAINFIEESVNHGHGVLVHCVYGVSRSSTLICAYLMKKHFMNLASAVSYVKKRRPQVNPNSGFLLQLCKFEKSSREDEKNECELGGVTESWIQSLPGLLEPLDVPEVTPLSSPRPEVASSEEV